MRLDIRPRFSSTLIAGFVLLTLSVLVEPTAEAQRKKVLNIAAKEPDNLDPHASTIGQSQAISRFMYRGLTRFAIKDGKVTTAEVEPISPRAGRSRPTAPCGRSRFAAASPSTKALVR